MSTTDSEMTQQASRTGIAARLDAVRVMRGIGDTKALWKEVTEMREVSGRTERGYDFQGEWKSVSYSAVRTWHTNREPPVHYVVRLSEVFDVNPEWLLTGSEAWLGRAREEVEQTAGNPETLAFLQKLDCGDRPRAPDRRAAVLRFARTLDDARGPDVPWDDPDAYREVLAVAMRFLVQVDEAAAVAERLDPTAEEDTVASRLVSPWFLPDSAAKGWYVSWSDAVLDLFARRVYGLGERSGGLTDSHAPVAQRPA